MFNLYKKNKYKDEYEISIFGVPFLRFGKKIVNGIKESFVDFFPISFEHEVLNKILKYTGNEHDYVLIIRGSGIGEVYILNFILDELIRTKNIKKLAIVTRYSHHLNIISAYHNIPIYILDDITQFELNELVTSKRNIKYKNVRFQVYYALLKEMRDNINKNWIEGNKIRPYLEDVLNWSGVNSLVYKEPEYKSEDIDYVNKKISELDLKNFIVLIPEANYVNLLEYEFWEKLAIALYKEGFNIFVNTTNFDKFKKFKTANLSPLQARYLVSKSKGVISLRCGFFELMSSLDIPKHVIYTKQRWDNLQPDKMIKIYSLLNYPNVKPETLHEYDINDYLEDNLIETIVESLKNEERIAI